MLLYQMGARAHAGGESRDRAVHFDKVGNHLPLRVRRSSDLRAQDAADRRSPRLRAASCGARLALRGHPHCKVKVMV